MIALDAAAISLRHFAPHHVSYEPMDLHTEAVQVTEENVGRLSLEFETELFFSDTNGLPYFRITVARHGPNDTTETGMTEWIVLTVRVGDWIIPLRGEIHVYRDVTFIHTFQFDARLDSGIHSAAGPVVDDLRQLNGDPDRVA